jgi:hypothetical protein
MAPEYLICPSFDISLHPNKGIGNDDFGFFYISHNDDNGGNDSICTWYLANSCNGIWPEDLLMGKVIIDNGILLARMMRLLHQNPLCNGPILTPLFESLFIDCHCIGNERTES